jgi:6-methylsalicylate decarboxylase
MDTLDTACACRPVSRREFLRAGGALAAMGALHGCASMEPGQNRFIDTHHHFFPPEYAKAWGDWQRERKMPLTSNEGWTPAVSLKAMEQGGVSTALVSLASTPGTWFDLPAAQVPRMARACNDYGARMVADYPGKYGLFATLPMLDIDSTLAEIAYALDTLKADGVGLQTSYGTRYPGDAFYRPVFDELNRRKALVYFHPLSPACCVPPGISASSSIIETPTDTTRAVLSLLNSGAFARYRDIRWLFSHAGGSLPMLAGRIKAFGERSKDVASYAPNGIERELKRLHFDTANGTHPAAMAALRTLVDTSQITYGSDYPYFQVAEQVQSLRSLGMSASDLRAIASGNALRLIPRLASA